MLMVILINLDLVVIILRLKQFNQIWDHHIVIKLYLVSQLFQKMMLDLLHIILKILNLLCI